MTWLHSIAVFDRCSKNSFGVEPPETTRVAEPREAMAPARTAATPDARPSASCSRLS